MIGFNIFEYLMCCGGMLTLFAIAVGSFLGEEEIRYEMSQKKRSHKV